MRATRFQAVMIVIKVIAVTLWITIVTVYRAHRMENIRETTDRILRWWSSKLLKFGGLSYKTFNPHGVEFHKNRPYIIMSNHSSLYDIPLIFMALPGSIRMLTKEELFQVPIWGLGLKAGEFVSVDRNNRRQAIRDLEEARRKMLSGIILWVAPEGTRSRTGQLGAFKKGGFMLALRTGATIVPVGIRGAFEVLPPKTLNFQLGKCAEIHVGKPVDASQYTTRTRDQLMREVEAKLRELAALPSAET